MTIHPLHKRSQDKSQTTPKSRKVFFQNTKFDTTLTSLIEKYMFYLQYEKNSSPKTMENYSLRLQRLVEFCGNIKIAELNRMQLLEYRMVLRDNGLSVKTINYHIVAIRAFLKFLLKNDIDCISPDKLELAKVAPREVNYLEEADIQAILSAPHQRNHNPTQEARDTTILQFLYGTGLRVSELVHLKQEDIKLDRNQFYVIGK
jgi:site-specific recombinase XerD